jgi:hypothetical protein
MSTDDELYAELKPDIEAVAEPLFELSTDFLRSNGNFLPHGVVLTERSEVQLVAAVPDAERDLTNSTEVLPVLHAGLRHKSRNMPLRAIGVAENVTIALEGKPSTQAIKVLCEHKRGSRLRYISRSRSAFFADTRSAPCSP